jgi:hypothetical protein
MLSKPCPAKLPRWISQETGVPVNCPHSHKLLSLKSSKFYTSAKTFATVEHVYW